MHSWKTPCMYCGYLMCAIVCLTRPVATLDCQANVKRIGPSLKTTLVCGDVALYNQTTPTAGATEVHFRKYGIKLFGRFPREEGLDHGVGILVFQGVSVSLSDSNFESLPAELPGGAVLAPIIVNNSEVSISNTTIDTQRVALTAGGAYITGRSAVTMRGCRFAKNFGTAAGVFEVHGQSHVEVRQCVFDRNSAIGFAGAIHLHGGSTLVVEDSSFLGVREHLPVADIFELRALFVGKYATHELKSFQANLISVAGAILVTEGSAATVSNSSLSGYGGQKGTVHVSGADSSVKLIKARFMDNFLWGGGGVYVEGSFAEVDSCWFERNMAKVGGGILVAGGGVLTMAGCHFKHNRALSRGGAVFVDGPSREVLTSQSAVRIEDSAFYGNEAKNGGGLYLMYSSLDMVGCQIEGNRAQSDGGGLFMFLAGTSTVVDSVFRGNEANCGGGLYVQRGESVSLVGVSLVSNKANGAGGGAHITAVEIVRLSTSVFLFNLAIESGGGLSLLRVGTTDIFGAQFSFNEAKLAGGALAASSSQGVQVCNSTFHDNIAEQYGGGLELQDTHSVVLKSSNFVHNLALRTDGGALYLLSGNDAEVWNCSFTDNSALHAGGAAALEGVDNFRVRKSNLSSNSAQQASGGALHLVGVGSIAVEESRLDSNHAAACGGGLSLHEQNDIVIRKTVFASNNATKGGALAVSSSRTITMTGSRFEGSNAVIVGGAVDLSNLGTVEVRNTHFAQNAVVCTEECQRADEMSATGMGRGGALHAALLDVLKFLNCSFENNSASVSGGAVVSRQVQSMGLESVNFVSNTCGQSGGAVIFDSTVEVNVTGGVMEGNVANFGGGLLLQGNTMLQGSDVKFLSNSAATSGGALACRGNASVVFNMSDFENDVGQDVNGPLVNCSCVVTFLNCAFVDEEPRTMPGQGGGICGAITMDNCTFDTATGHNFTAFFFWGMLDTLRALQALAIILFCLFFLMVPICMTLTKLTGFNTVKPKFSKKEADTGSEFGGLSDPAYFDSLTRPLLEAPFVPFQPCEVGSEDSTGGEERDGCSMIARLRPVMPLFPFVPKSSSSEASSSCLGQDSRSSAGTPCCPEHEQTSMLRSQGDAHHGDAWTPSRAGPELLAHSSDHAPPVSEQRVASLQNMDPQLSCLPSIESEAHVCGCAGIGASQVAGAWQTSAASQERYRTAAYEEGSDPGQGSYQGPRGQCINQMAMDAEIMHLPVSNLGASNSGRTDYPTAACSPTLDAWQLCTRSRGVAAAVSAGEASNAGSSDGHTVDQMPIGLHHHPVHSPTTSISANSDSLLGGSPPLVDSWQLEEPREDRPRPLPWAVAAGNAVSSHIPLACPRTHPGPMADPASRDSNGVNGWTPHATPIQAQSSVPVSSMRSPSGQGHAAALEGVHPREVASFEWERGQQMRPSNESEGGVGHQASQGLSIRDRRCRMQLVLSFGFFNVTLEI